MSLSKSSLSLVLGFSIAAATSAAAEIQCVSVHIPAFVLAPDLICRVSKNFMVKKYVPDQVFLNDIGVPAADTCFNLIDPYLNSKRVPGTITNPATGEEFDIAVYGIAGQTLNAYPPHDPTDPNPFDAISFTAVTAVGINIGNKQIGKLVTRDAGTIFAYGNVAARLSVVAGTKKFENVTGYVDEVGQEFNPFDPAEATGVLCGEELAEALFEDDDVDFEYQYLDDYRVVE